MHTVFALLCFVVVIHWLIFPYPSGLLHWHCGNLTIAPVPAKQPWWIWINTSYEFIMNDCITTPKQSTTKPCAYFLGYTVLSSRSHKSYEICLWAEYYVDVEIGATNVSIWTKVVFALVTTRANTTFVHVTGIRGETIVKNAVIAKITWRLVIILMEAVTLGVERDMKASVAT